MTLKHVPTERHAEETTEAAEQSTGEILLIQEFVKRLGGLDRARLALETLESLRNAA